MSTYLKSILRYVFALVVMAILLWVSFKQIAVTDNEDPWQALWTLWVGADKGNLLMMAIILTISHLLRAYRWKMLLLATTHKVSLIGSFLSLLVGYLINLVVPRAGELVRCYAIHEWDNVPMGKAIGTVVAERIVDLCSLLVVACLVFFVAQDRLVSLVNVWQPSGSSQIIIWLVVILLFLIVMVLIARHPRIKKVINHFKEGVLSVLRLKQSFLFFILSVLIWLLYFLSTWYTMEAFVSTRGLGLEASATLLFLGAIAVSLPLPGGLGSYHALAPLGLVLYGVAQSDATVAAFVFHVWQTVVIIVPGVLSLCVGYSMLLWKRRKAK